jgi:diadenylate cyclase
MDGAIILSEDGKKILYANALLYPNLNIPTKETGTRHKAAERTARQTKAIVLAVSERKNKITLYYSGIKHVLDRSAEILRKRQILYKFLKKKELYDDAIINFNFWR